MAVRKLSYFLYDTKVTITCDHAPFYKPLTVHTLNSKANNWETDIVSMSNVMFEHIKGMETS